IPAGGCSAADPLDAGDIVYPAAGQPSVLQAPTGIVVAHGLPNGIRDGTLFVADSTANVVWRIDPVAHTPEQATGPSPGAWALHLDGPGTPRPYFVADAGTPRVLEIAPHPPQSSTEVALGGAPDALSVLDANLVAWRALVAEPAAQVVAEAPFPTP